MEKIILQKINNRGNCDYRGFRTIDVYGRTALMVYLNHVGYYGDKVLNARNNLGLTNKLNIKDGMAHETNYLSREESDYLIKNSDLSFSNPVNKWSILMYGLRWGNDMMDPILNGHWDDLINNSDLMAVAWREGRNALYYAAKGGRTEIAKKIIVLLDNKYQVNFTEYLEGINFETNRVKNNIYTMVDEYLIEKNLGKGANNKQNKI